MITSDEIKKIANQIGFFDCGITKPTLQSEQVRYLQNWISNGYHGSMSYMEKNHDIRENILSIYPECKSVVVVLLNYFQPDKSALQTEIGKISSYALGQDYHFVLKEKLNFLLMELKKINPEIEGKMFTDSAPIFERELARHAGLGWIGKNTMLISKKQGSFFFIGELLLNVELEIDKPVEKNYCGTCTACLENCPTQAFESPGVLNAGKCISYWTIEHKSENKPPEIDLNDWIWGCDICQDVCPWNIKFSIPAVEELFKPNLELQTMNVEKLTKITENGFRKVFKFSPLSRRGKKGILRNIKWNAKNN